MAVSDQIGPFQNTPLSVSVELPCDAVTLEDFLLLEPGSTLVSDRAAGDTMDLRIGGSLIARGEMVMTDHGLGVRITSSQEGS